MRRKHRKSAQVFVTLFENIIVSFPQTRRCFMSKQLRFLWVLAMTSCLVMTLWSQTRKDAIWARTTTNPITLDGKMNEADWAKAESLQVFFGQESGLPGSGYNADGWAVAPTDPVRATIKFLVVGDSLYIGIVCKDSSIGGGDWPGPAKWDGLLGAILDRSVSTRPLPRREIFYGWVATDWADPTLNQPGKLPGYFGAYGGSRTDTITDANMPQFGLLKGQVWDAKTTVQGTTNDDSKIDTSWTTEFKFNLHAFGYTPQNAAGDIIPWNTSIYDADWQWYTGVDSASKAHFMISKAWTQGQWGGGDSYNYLRIFVKPTVTVNSGALPTIAPDLVIPGAGNYPPPTIDGKLNEWVWNNPNVGTLQLKYGDNTIRSAYPQSLSYTSGQYQPQVNGGLAAITDANLATVKWFYKADTLYLGFNVADKVIQSVPGNPDRWDGIRVTINDRGARNGDSVQITRALTFIIDSAGHAMRMEDLSNTGWDSTGTKVQVATYVRGTVDTLGATPDTAYTAEMKIALTSLGYPAGRGDGALFLGVTMFDGDSYGLNYTQSYGSRVWFARENPGKQASAWAYMDPGTVLSVGQVSTTVPAEFKIYGNYPNPFNPSTTIKFAMPQRAQVTLEVFDILGRLVGSQDLGVRQAGDQMVEFNAAKLASGVYTYRVRTASQMAVGRMLLLK
jgi:hypothetical protein